MKIPYDNQRYLGFGPRRGNFNLHKWLHDGAIPVILVPGYLTW
jgi:hypothetical protein